MASMTEPLPPEVRRTLASEGPTPAGEHLVRFAERIARAKPGEARRWGMRLARTCFDDEVMTGCARWAGGVAMYLAGDVASAEPALKEAARRLREADSDALADRASLLLVDLYGERLALGRARRLAMRLHRNFRSRGDSERAAASLANLAGVEDAADRVARARDLWRRARRDFAPGSMRRLLTDANLGNVAALEGRLREAAADLRRVAAEARREGMDGLALTAELNVAEVEFAAGEVDSAFARWADVIRGAKSRGDLAVEVAAGIDLARAEAEIGDIAGAGSRLGGVLARARAAGLDREAARGARLLAVVEASSGVEGAMARAEEMLRAPAFAVQRDLLLVDMVQLDPSVDPGRLTRASRRLIRSGHLHRGRLGLAWAARRSLERGKHRRARELAREVLAVRRMSPWAGMLAHHVLGVADRRGGVRHLLAAARLADEVCGRLAATADRQAFLKVSGEVYLDLLAALLARNRPSDRHRALVITDRLRAGWLFDELARRSDRGDDEEVKRWQELRRQLASLLHEVEGAGEPRVRRSGLKVHSQIRSLERAVRRAQTELARRWPPAATGAGAAAADELLQVLPPGESFVGYLLDRDDLVLFHGRDGSLTVHVDRGGAGRIADLLASVRFHMDGATWLDDRRRPTHEAALDERLRRLGEILLGPVSLDGADRLWIAPHADLCHVPWAALHHPEGGRLIDRVSFTLVPGAGPAAMLLRQTARRPSSVAVGGAAAHDLPLVEREVRELAEIFGGATVATATTRADFLRLVGEHELVHLAGHALFIDGLPFASGLKMSDGFVTVHDLAATRLAARYVSFGVCSGLRLGRDAGDRYAGFVLALVSGGVRTVVGPVAPVRDDVAYTFDLELHRQLHDLGDPGRAFVGAVRAVRELDPRPSTWGNFLQWGDTRPWGTP